MKRVAVLSLASFLACVVFVAPRAASAQGMDGMDWIQKSGKDTAEVGKQVQVPNTLSEKEVKGGWRLLWDGTTTTGWHKFGGGPVVGWDIVNGELIALGKGGDHANDIVTDEDYDSFELTVEWKLDPRANSGIFYHVVEQGFDRIYASAPEYQLIDDKGWPDKLETWQNSGANYAMNPPSKIASKPIGEWNLTRIVVKGPKVQHFLNGSKVVEYEFWTPQWETLKKEGKWKDFPGYGLAKAGKIGLQDHGNKVYFRNIKIRPLK